MTPTSRPTRPGRATLVLILVAMIPMVVGAVALAEHGWSPSGEFAQADLRMQDFWSHPPQLGATGRLRDGDQVSSHPGPAAWWMMEPVYAVLGRGSAALSTAVAVMAIVWLAIAVWLAARRGGFVFAVLVAVVLLVYARALGPSSFLEPWNPWFGIFPFAVFVLAVWESVEQTWWAPILAVTAGSFCVEAHVGYAPMVAALLLIPAAAIVRGLIRDGPRRGHWWGALGGSVAAAGAMWILPIHEQLTNNPGNMTVLVRAYSHQTDPALGFRGALRLFGEYFDLAGPWITHHPTEPTGHGATVGTAVLLALWTGAAIVAWRRRRDPGWGAVVALHGVLAVTTVVALATATRIKGEVFHYLVAWLPIIPCLVIAAIGWTAWRWFATRDGNASRATRSMTVAALVAIVTVASVQFARVGAPGGWLSDSTAALGRRVGGRLDPSGPTLVRWDDPVAFGGVGFGMLADLEHQGFDVGADATYRTEVVPHRVMDPAHVSRVLYVVTGAGIDRWRTAGVDRVAAFDPRTPAERREATALHERIVAELQSTGHADAAAHLDENYWAVLNDPSIPTNVKAMIERYTANGLPTAVFLLPPDVTPPA
jgi:hypothetical protein